MKRLAVFLMIPILLTGCGLRKQKAEYRVVTGVQVHYEQPGNTLDRTYTKPASMQSILTYLRILKPFGPVNPDIHADSTCRITLQYSHGPDSVYVQQGQQYLQKDGGDWQTIDTSRASLLYPLLLLLPSDR